MDRALQVLLLVFVLLFNIGIDFRVFLCLVLNVREELFVDVLFEEVVIVDVSGNLVDGSLETLNEHVVFADAGSGLLDQLLHLFLAGTQIVNQVTQVCIHLVKLLQFLIHFVGLGTELVNFHLAGSNVSLQFLDLVVKHKLKLLQLLSLLLERINFLLTITNLSVLNLNLVQLHLVLLVKRINQLVLLGKLHFLVLDLALKLINLSQNIGDLVFGQLKLSLGLQAHLLNLSHVLLVLSVNILNFLICVILDLTHCLLVVFFH